MDDLDRLHQHLVDTLRDGYPHLVGRRFRLRDIPEHFVEYRKRRSELGLQSAAQYEIALMRLASGERGYLQGDPAAQDAFRRALAGPEPDVGLLREHGDAQVWLAESPAAPVRAAEGGGDSVTGVGDGFANPSPESVPQVRPPNPSPSPSPRPDTTARSVGGTCQYCGHALPEGRAVTFCPNCGQNVTVRHCPACSTELEIGWHFCITCGRAMDETGLDAPTP